MKRILLLVLLCAAVAGMNGCRAEYHCYCQTGTRFNNYDLGTKGNFEGAKKTCEGIQRADGWDSCQVNALK